MGDDGGSQDGWWPGGEEAQKELKPAEDEEAGGEHTMDACEGGPLPAPHSEARSLENMVMASGKLGGVAGVFLGVHICEREIRSVCNSRECFRKKGRAKDQPEDGFLQKLFLPSESSICTSLLSVLKQQQEEQFSVYFLIRPAPVFITVMTLLYFSTAENRFCRILPVDAAPRQNRRRNNIDLTDQ